MTLETINFITDKVEEAELTLQTVANLLLTFQEFYGRECPQEDQYEDAKKYMDDATSYAARSRVQIGQICAALELTDKAREDLKAAICKRFRGD